MQEQLFASFMLDTAKGLEIALRAENPMRIQPLYSAIEDTVRDRLHFIQPREAGHGDITAVHSTLILKDHLLLAPVNF